MASVPVVVEADADAVFRVLVLKYFVPKEALEQNHLAGLGLDSEKRLIFGSTRSFPGGRGHETRKARVLKLNRAAFRRHLKVERSAESG